MKLASFQYHTSTESENTAVGSGLPQGDLTDSKWVFLKEEQAILVALSPRGIQFYEWDGSEFLHYHQINQPEEGLKVFPRGESF